MTSSNFSSLWHIRFACERDTGDPSNIFLSGIVVFVKPPSTFEYASNISCEFFFDLFDSVMLTSVPFASDAVRLAISLSSYLLFVNTLPSDTIKNVSIILELKKIPSPEWFFASVVSLPLNSSHTASSSVGKPK